MGRRRGTSAFPVARIKKMMQSDDDVGKIATVTPVLVAKSLELMMQYVLEEAANIAIERNTKTVTPQHLKTCVMNNDSFDFLRDTLKGVQPLEEDRRRKKRPRSPAGEGRKVRRVRSQRKGKTGDEGKVEKVEKVEKEEKVEEEVAWKMAPRMSVDGVGERVAAVDTANVEDEDDDYDEDDGEAEAPPEQPAPASGGAAEVQRTPMEEEDYDAADDAQPDVEDTQRGRMSVSALLS